MAKLEVVIEAVTKGLETGLKKAEGRLQKTSHAAGVAGLALAGGLAVGLEKSVSAAMDAQASQAKLEAAFKASGVSATRFAPQIEKAEAASRKLGFTEEDVHGSLASLIVATHNYGAAAKDMGVAEDIARFKHISLEGATKMLTMAMAGSQRATKQLGLTVEKSTANADAAKAAYDRQRSALEASFPSVAKMTDAQKAQLQAAKDNLAQQYAADKATATLQDKSVTSAKVIDLVSQKLHGQSQAYADTAAGGMAQFKAQLNFLEITIGTALIPVLSKAATTLANLTAFFSEHEKVTKALIVVTVGVTTVLITAAAATKAWAAVQVVAKAATVAWTAAQWLLNAALDANPIGIVILALGALVTGLVLAYEHSATFRRIVQGALEAVAAAADFVKEHWRLMLAIMLGPIGVALGHIDAIKGAIQTLAGWIQTAVNAVERLQGALDSIHAPHKILGIPTGPSLKSLLGFAGGTSSAPGGLAMVGEKGPELVNLPRGSSVTPNSALGGNQTIQLILDGSVLAEVLIDPLRNQARLVQQRTGRPAFS